MDLSPASHWITSRNTEHPCSFMVILFFRCLTPPGALSPLATRLLSAPPRSITISINQSSSNLSPKSPHSGSYPSTSSLAPSRCYAGPLPLSPQSTLEVLPFGKGTYFAYVHASKVLHHPTQGWRPGGASTLESWTALKFGLGIFLDVSWTELTGETCTPYSATDNTYYVCRGRCESWLYSILLKAPRRPHWNNC